MKTKSYVVIPFLTGADNETSIRFLNATFQVKDDFVKKYPDPDFGAWLIDQIYNVKKILAKEKGLFKKSYLCSSCSSVLNPDSQKLMEITYELKYLEFTPFIVKITIPSVECPQCKKTCVIDLKGSLSDHLNESIIHAFDSQNINP